ncbi:uncharacterized protein [Ptychodera flava]|uniref:uncharacterized protein n=1 Tax=Ptychodera flava TaxID=63121 RepID=UPI003969E045
MGVHREVTGVHQGVVVVVVALMEAHLEVEVMVADGGISGEDGGTSGGGSGADGGGGGTGGGDGGTDGGTSGGDGGTSGGDGGVDGGTGGGEVATTARDDGQGHVTHDRTTVSGGYSTEVTDKEDAGGLDIIPIAAGGGGGLLVLIIIIVVVVVIKKKKKKKQRVAEEEGEEELVTIQTSTVITTTTTISHAAPKNFPIKPKLDISSVQSPPVAVAPEKLAPIRGPRRGTVKAGIAGGDFPQLPSIE